MSRTIKYRVWDNENKSYNDPYSSAYYAMAQDGGLDFYCHGDHMRGADPDVYFIEQYTGLTDKNGKEIYEGDIVKTTDRVTVKGLIFPIGVVEFKQQAFWICNVPSERPDFTHNETLLQYWETDLEVIGNVHENPELLGGEE